MGKWLLKTEPEEYSWDQLCEDKSTVWDGVRNFQAQNNLRSMKFGDLAFFYHTGSIRKIIGIVKVTEVFYFPQGEQKFGVVVVAAVSKMCRPVAIKEIKNHSNLVDMAILKQPRLSVAPISPEEWSYILCLGSGIGV